MPTVTISGTVYSIHGRLDQKVRDGHGTQRQDWAQLAAASGGAVALIAPFSAKQARRFATGVGRSGPKQNHTRRVTALPPPVDASTHDLQPPVDSHLDLVDARLLSDDIFIIAHTVAPTGGGAGCEADRTGGDLPQLTLYAVLPPHCAGVQESDSLCCRSCPSPLAPRLSRSRRISKPLKSRTEHRSPTTSLILRTPLRIKQKHSFRATVIAASRARCEEPPAHRSPRIVADMPRYTATGK